MAFWSTEKIKHVAKTWGLITPYDPEHLDCGSYHLTVGPEIFITSTGGTKKQLQQGEQVTIPPGQLAIVVTEEEVHIPNEAIGFISMRASIKLGGLINVSGFHVDPGYQSRLKFSVYNAGDQPSVLTRGDPIFLIWFADLDQATNDAFKSDPKKHGVITSSDVARLQGTMPTPTALKAELEKLRTEFNDLKSQMKSWRFWLANILVGVLVGAVAGLLVWRLTRESAPSSSSTPKPTGSDSGPVRNGSAGNASASSDPPSQSEPSSPPAATPSPSASPPPPASSTKPPPTVPSVKADGGSPPSM